MSCSSAMGTMSSFNSEEVIVISSDDEDYDGMDIISDSDDIEAAQEDKRKIFKQHACNYRPFNPTTTTSPILIEDSDEEELPEFCISHENRVKREDSDEEELPDLCIRHENFIKAEDSDGKLPDLCVTHKIEVMAISHSNLQKRNQSDVSEPPAKIVKLENDLTFGIEMTILKKKISNSILRGGLKGQIMNKCNSSFTSCYETHKNQPKSNATPMQSKALFETMMDDENLQLFALRAMSYRAVTEKQYLEPSLLNILLQYLFGSELKHELPGADGLHLGISILYKLLNYHPPCKQGMHHIYLKMCQDWFGVLLQKVKALLRDEPSTSEGAQENIQPVEYESEDSFFDYTPVIRRKANEKKKRYLSIKKDEKLMHVGTLMKYFSKVMEQSFISWSIRHWQRKSSGLFRKDICPILSEIVWGSSTWTGDWGSVNPSVQELFDLYCKSSKVQSLHESFGSVIATCAAILHRKEMCVYPEMGPMTRTYAHKLYMEIKSSTDVEVNLKRLHPDWLKFHVASLFLGVEAPANFYKTRERISNILYVRHKDNNLNYSSFNAEIVCMEAIKAMMGIMQLKSSEPEHCDLAEKVLEENNSWFSDSLQDETISYQLRMLKTILSLPCIRTRKWYFDGFESH